jgi:hypothetical protein
MAVVCLLLVLGIQLNSVLGASNAFKATALFEVTANSTCGRDAPNNFVHEGEVFNCSDGDYPAASMLDGNPSTWWQSENGDDPVSVMFSLGGLEVIVIAVRSKTSRLMFV